MTETIIYTRASRADVIHALKSLPQRARAGGVVQDAMMTKCGIALLSHIKEAFVVKSQGGTDEAGEHWKPLSPKYIAYRRAKRSRAEVAQSAFPSQALTDKQRDRWWSVYRQQLARFKGNKSSAAKVAWTILRSEGAHTLFDKYATEKVDILIDTRELVDSLTPHSGSNKSIFRVLPGEVELGTSREHALAHHTGVPQNNLPQRRLWPSPQNWPDSWVSDILTEVQTGIVDLTIQVVKEVGE